MHAHRYILSILILLGALHACKKSSSPPAPSPSSNTATFTPSRTSSATSTTSPTPTLTFTTTPSATKTPTSTATSTHTSIPVCTVTPGVAVQGETESNNSTGTADDLGTIGPTGLWVTGTLDVDTDNTDYFLFTASTTGYYDFTVDCRASEAFSLTVYCSGELVAMVGGSGLLHHPHFAQAGQSFHLRINTTSGSGSYDLKLSATPFTAAPAVCTSTPGTGAVTPDIEPNNTSGSPQDLGSVGPGGIWIQGAVNMAADGSDYFSFTANTTGPYTFDLDCWNNAHLNLDATFYGCAACPGFASGLGLKTYTLNAISGTTYQIRVYPSSGGGFYDLKCR